MTWRPQGLCCKIGVLIRSFNMNLHEYQAKSLLRDYGIAVPRGMVVEHFSRVALAVQVDVSSHSLHMRLLSAPVIVFETDTPAQWFQQSGGSVR